MLTITTLLHCIFNIISNFLLDYQYQDLNTSNKPVKPVNKLFDRFFVNNIYEIFFVGFMFVILIPYFVYITQLKQIFVELYDRLRTSSSDIPSQ